MSRARLVAVLAAIVACLPVVPAHAAFTPSAGVTVPTTADLKGAIDQEQSDFKSQGTALAQELAAIGKLSDRIDALEARVKKLEDAASPAPPTTTATTPTPPPPPPAGKVLWDGGPLAGPDAWSDLHAQSPDRVKVTTRSGRLAYQFTVQNGDVGGVGARAELGQDSDQGPNAGEARELHLGQEYWIGYGILFPAGFNAGAWTVLSQHKDQPDQGGPTVGLFTGTEAQGGRLQVDGNVTPHHPGGSTNVVWAPLTVGPPAREVWHNIVLHIVESTDPAKGLLEVYYSTDADPVKLVPATSQHRQTWTPGVDQEAPRLGLYHDPAAGTQSVYHSTFKVGTSLAAVTPTP